MPDSTDAHLPARYDAYQSTWAAQKWDRWTETVSADYRFSIGGVPVGGVEATLLWSKAIFGSFPDYRQDVRSVFVDGDWLIVEAVASGTANGEHPFGHGGSVPRSGARFELPYIKVLRFKDGVVLEDRQYHDTARLVEQLGLLASAN